MRIKKAKLFFVLALSTLCLSISGTAAYSQISGSGPPTGPSTNVARFTGSIYATSVSITETGGTHQITVSSNAQLTMHQAGDSGEVVRSCVLAKDVGFGMLVGVIPDDLSSSFKSNPQSAISTADYFDTFNLTFSGLSPGNYVMGLSLSVEPDGTWGASRVADTMVAFTID